MMDTFKCIDRLRETAVARLRHYRVQLLLWTLWTLAVVGTALRSWRTDMLATHQLNLLGLVIHCLCVGCVGLVALTMIEVWVVP